MSESNGLHKFPLPSPAAAGNNNVVPAGFDHETIAKAYRPKGAPSNEVDCATSARFAHRMINAAGESKSVEELGSTETTASIIAKLGGAKADPERIGTEYMPEVVDIEGIVFPTGTTAEIDAVEDAEINEVMIDSDRKALVRFTSAATYETIISEPVQLKYAYVDHVNGNNTTAQLGNDRLPYSTINAALQAVGTYGIVRVAGNDISETDCLNGITGGNYTIALDGTCNFTTTGVVFNTIDSTAALSITILAEYALCVYGKFVTITDTQITTVVISCRRSFSGQLECSNSSGSLILDTPFWLHSGSSNTPTFSAGKAVLSASRFRSAVSKEITQTGGTVTLRGLAWKTADIAAGKGFFSKSGGTTWMDVRFAWKTYNAGFPPVDGKPINSATAQTIILLGPLALPVKSANITFDTTLAGVTTGTAIGAAGYDPENIINII